MAQVVKNPPVMRETWVRSLGWEDPLEKGMPRIGRSRQETAVQPWGGSWVHPKGCTRRQCSSCQRKATCGYFKANKQLIKKTPSPHQRGGGPAHTLSLSATPPLNHRYKASVPLFGTQWTAAHQAPLSMGFSRRKHGRGLPCPSPGDLPNQGWNPGLPHCKQTLYCLSFPWKPPRVQNPSSDGLRLQHRVLKTGACCVPLCLAMQ